MKPWIRRIPRPVEPKYPLAEFVVGEKFHDRKHSIGIMPAQ
jgi:hypothetical protein